jgi:pimeloyl-ACP methyl ester carboxylesterase
MAVGTGTSLQARRLTEVSRAFASLSERFLGAEDGFEATYHVILGDVGRTWEVKVTRDSCRVSTSASRKPDVVIGTDAATWLALRAGRLSGLDAFSQRRLYARGDLDLAVGFEGLFRLPDDRSPLLRVHDVRVQGARISTVTAGSGDRHVILLHGLGGTKVSFFETLAALSASGYRVHAVDLPGFGSSSKPPRAPYDSAFFARTMLRFMDTLAIDRAHLVGNSMGGRVALEMALSAPARVRSLGLLAPALAFLRRREFVPLVRLLRPELGAIPHNIGENRVRAQFWSMFARPERLDPTVAEVACDEFARIFRSRAARIAFYASARNIYLDPPHGGKGFWTRLRRLERPALFVWGSHDTLVPSAFAHHVAESLPAARQVLLDDCGHVPQVELPEMTNSILRDFLAEAEGRRPRLAATA